MSTAVETGSSPAKSNNSNSNNGNSNSGNGNPSPNAKGVQRRQLRERKQRKLYLDEWSLGDDDGEGTRGFSVAEKLESSKFAQAGMVREMRGCDLTVAFLQQHGFNIPLLFRDKAGLGLKMPDPQEFTVNDVRLCVGSRRLLDVMDVNTQKNLQMTMKEWQQYYDNPQKDRLLNVISLEFSHTRLDRFIQSPEIVRQIDWVDVVWPKQLKDAQREGTNLLGGMMYPKVQKYCLMSVKNCYTDFHIDFGGTSVWYHILRGSKVFWLIPPTDRNLQLYEKWVLSGKQADVFFGDTVEKCARVYLTAGNTFFIPTGWIHAVYTPTQSLVFGGNFLHSFGIVKQLKTASVEDSTKVPQKFRYPFFTEMLWYVLARYVHTLLGHSHLDGEPSLSEAEMAARPHTHLTHHELFGLKEIVMYLYDLPPQKKNVPSLVLDPVALIKDVRSLVERHCKDQQDLAITGVSVLKTPSDAHPQFQLYDRTRVKQEIKQEIARKNAEVIREQQQLEAGRARDAESDASASTGAGSVMGMGAGIEYSNGVMKKEQLENGSGASAAGHTSQPEATFVLPTDTMKYRPPKKMHLAQAVAAASSSSGTPGGSTGGGSSVIASNQCPTAGAATVAGLGQPISVIATCSSYSDGGTGGGISSLDNCPSPGEGGPKLSPNLTGAGQPRRRRTRCKNCAACQRSDCGTCPFCMDMVKFGGPGRAKQTCMMRQCLSPMLPVTAQCVYCHLDGWRQTPVSPQTKQLASIDGPSALMECSVCYEIAHPDCALSQLDGTEDAADAKGIVNEDLPNSWECPSCCRSGKNYDYKPRHFRARQKSSEVRRVSVSHGPGGTGDGHQEGSGLPLPVGQYNDFVFTSESEMESGTASGHMTHWKHGMKRHHQLEVKTERNNSCDTPSPGISPNAVGGDSKVGKRRKSDDGTSVSSSMQESNDAPCSSSVDGAAGTGNPNVSTSQWSSGGGGGSRKKNSIRSQLAQQMLNSSTRVLKKPQYVVRPAGISSSSSSGGNGSGSAGGTNGISNGNNQSGANFSGNGERGANNGGLSGSNGLSHHSSAQNLAMDPTVLKIIFRYLPQDTLVTCCSVCKVWSNAAVDPDLWKTMNCSEHKMSASLLTAIVRRQPEHLILDWTQIAKRQLAWLVARLPALKNLSLQNCPIQAVLALHTCLCPPLQTLDLSFVRGLNDAAVRDILSPPKDSRPGLSDSKTRLRDLKVLKLAGTDISDVAVRYITQSLPHLRHLDLSSCQRITDAGVAQIGTSTTAIARLAELNLSACRLVSENALEHLAKCEMLVWLDLRHVPQVSTQSVIRFASNSKHDLCVRDIKLVERRRRNSTTVVRSWHHD
ncbi:jmjC domain-containing histone demethylation protein 1 [Drosophila bipectinata]|uniref:jmjC domain-containing histone demethylation protein 1 n=1 Tax=Drosophila bipectinata TaxID=42026 RepID=UPI001C897AB9|nr:jmjC domain-containing histone demethylation protein 1 [Drosophila bipectinata]XP_017088586.2 jmjC domain-containing histone demethylation protein 1 [Drosophila bipectinata]XP_017088587.2 jmjC domain-containing histone demethylation protein 1 [Drosophila bipectinata]XP_043067918.1 jmjC domain-containing histone demethylation protein 1 [Drosophila bipectinata]